MKIAVSSENEMTTHHFGHCLNFNIFTAENGEIIKTESVDNPGHQPGFLPDFLEKLGVNVIISGGMGAKAIALFEEKNIEVITGAQGKAMDMAKEYLKGNLKSTGSVCHAHEHKGECGNH